ncbi:hypothetical protein RSOLAG1IB_10763 [Rhizoctonia solani AG-1 IB]|uniref:Uncharacterized protein n=1 Tax=Thanatephorus cucumeris (strain AG1-IB / isolate 7/3/14) TaxID=1108050 RepID=A0A0B7G0E9_THACB|nr:hypothetical protein RSOLAG1IB_10763 [Rhizoctonia solani AG-1 IB]
MTTSHPKITAHEAFRRLSDEFSNPYPPYVLVNSEEDAKSVLSAGCEPGYLLILETDDPSSSKSLKLEKIGEFQGRVGIVIYTVPLEADLDLVIEADRVLKYLAIGGTAIGFATLQQSAQWKQACFEWAKLQKTSDGQHSTKDGFELEWTDKNVDGHGDQWAQWSLIKKTPEWAFC